MLYKSDSNLPYQHKMKNVIHTRSEQHWMSAVHDLPSEYHYCSHKEFFRTVAGDKFIQYIMCSKCLSPFGRLRTRNSLHIYR